jgi:hypothetical protein
MLTSISRYLNQLNFKRTCRNQFFVLPTAGHFFFAFQFDSIRIASKELVPNWNFCLSSEGSVAFISAFGLFQDVFDCFRISLRELFLCHDAIKAIRILLMIVAHRAPVLGVFGDRFVVTLKT